MRLELALGNHIFVSLEFTLKQLGLAEVLEALTSQLKMKKTSENLRPRQMFLMLYPEVLLLPSMAVKM